MDAKKKQQQQECQLNARPTSILRVSGSYRSNHLSNNPSITINLPHNNNETSTGTDASDAQAQQQRRQRREHFEQLRRDHYHNMYSTISGHRQSAVNLSRNSSERDSTQSSNMEKSSKK